ncbi:hypothetical protein HDU98_010307 [Podochytrium sp. JEL0797]|nr:hypothetical protein HDU98_010307 [Podochytrium sp. JEL0797]
MFGVQLCESKTHCGQGYFVITRNDVDVCMKEFEQDLSVNKVLDKYLKERIGPDAFHMIFDGPERAAPTMWHQTSRCVYKLPYRLTNPGTFAVSLLHAYTSFDGVNEVENKWPKVIGKNLLPASFELSVCPSCPTFSIKNLESMELNVCGRIYSNQGVYLKMTGETEREKYKFENYKKGYIWAPLGCRYDQLFELNENSDCFNKRNYSIRLYGDSHTRVLSDTVDARLAGSTRHLSKNPKGGDRDSLFYNDRISGTAYSGDGTFAGLEYSLRSSVQDPTSHVVSSVNRTRLQYISGPHIENLIAKQVGHDWDGEKMVTNFDKEMAEFDVLQFGFGHWASGPEENNGHFTVERWLDHVELAADYIQVMNWRRQRLGLKPMVVIWHGVNGFALKTDPDAWLIKAFDWRTNYRFKIWSMYAERAIARRAGFKMMNSFEMTFPWVQESEDGSHMHTLPAVDAQVDELLHKLNICNW